MTLQDLFDYLAENPLYILFYFTIVPLIALIAGWFDQDRGHHMPWNYTYAFLIYAVSVPGIFALSFDVYMFLFERRSIMQTDVLLQILPVASMIFTLLIISRNVDLDYVPGFDRLSGLLFIIGAVIALMWIIDRTRIIVFSYLRFEYVLLIFVGLLLLVRFGWSRMFSSSYRSQG